MVDKPTKNEMNTTYQVQAVELFTGCGGLAYGMSEAKIRHLLMVEWNEHAAKTIHFNSDRNVRHVTDWPFVRSDVRLINWSRYRGQANIVAGGPPCQPFSVGGKAAGHRDARDMWPEAIRAVREIQPDAFIFENVRGLLRPAFAEYVRWITSFLERPDIEPKQDETSVSHLSRLLKDPREPLYDVSVYSINAADFGAPQKRHRVFFVGVKRSLGVVLGDLPTSHTLAKLVWDKWITGDYWDRHRIARKRRPEISFEESRVLRCLHSQLLAPVGEAWVTCRDAFSGLGEPTTEDDGRNHRYQAGARSYAGHTGSPLDEPAKALKAGVHGVPGGENMLLLDSGNVRYFTIREAARLQGLPDDYRFPGSWTESMRQIGNAVPTMLATGISRWVLEKLPGCSVKQAA